MVGGHKAQEAACGGRKVATSAISPKKSRLPRTVLAVRLQDGGISTSGRALQPLEQAQAA